MRRRRPARRDVPWPGTPHHDAPKRTLPYIVGLAVIVVCLLPALAVWWSSQFADRQGYILNEAGHHPCIVGGTDWGGTRGGAFNSGWLMLLILRPAALTAEILLILAVSRLLCRR